MPCKGDLWLKTIILKLQKKNHNLRFFILKLKTYGHCSAVQCSVVYSGVERVEMLECPLRKREEGMGGSLTSSDIIYRLQLRDHIISQKLLCLIIWFSLGGGPAKLYF